jgi:translation initiation factor 4E
MINNKAQVTVTPTTTTPIPAQTPSTKNRNKDEQLIVNDDFILTFPAVNNLEYAYSFWFSKRLAKGRLQQVQQSQSGNVNYDANLRQVGTFDTVEKFWAYYSHMVRTKDLSFHADIHLFKDGIRPLWEDEANKNGGKWIVRLRKGLADRCWENLILAILGEQFMVGEEICGAVVSVRFQVCFFVILIYKGYHF